MFSKIIFACLLALPIHAKMERGYLQLTSSNTEHFMAKFAITPGRTGSMNVYFKGDSAQYLNGHAHAMKWLIFDEKEWAAYRKSMESGSLCVDRARIPSITKDFRPGRNDPSIVELKMLETFTPVQTTHYYYFLVSDCSLEYYDAHPPMYEYSLHLLNGAAELPADEEGLAVVHGATCAALVAVALACGRGLAGQLRRFGKMHLSVLALTAAVLLQALACFMECVHLVTYGRDGMGYRWRHGRVPLDFLSDTCQNLSEAVTVTLLVCVAQGWTLVDGTASRLGTAAGAALCVGALQLLLEVASRRFEEDFASFHDHDHWPGAALMLLRVGACGALLAGVRATLRRVGGLGGGGLGGGGQGDHPQARFLRALGVAGAVWLLAFPATVLGVAPRVAPHRRHWVVTTAALALQSTALGALAALFLGLGQPGAAFLRASTLSAMGDLGSTTGSGGGAHAGSSSGGAVSKFPAAVRRKVATD